MLYFNFSETLPYLKLCKITAEGDKP